MSRIIKATAVLHGASKKIGSTAITVADRLHAFTEELHHVVVQKHITKSAAASFDLKEKRHAVLNEHINRIGAAGVTLQDEVKAAYDKHELTLKNLREETDVTVTQINEQIKAHDDKRVELRKLLAV